MTETPPIRCIASAQDELKQVREWLLHPCADSLEACPSALARAVAYVNDLSSQIDPSAPDPHLKYPLLELSREIQATKTLLDAATTLHLGRLQRMT
jgi:hypothetical protein